MIAQNRNRSGASNSLTLDSPLRVTRLENGFFSVEGTPTDCVHLALTGLLEEKPDIIVSGINEGANLGDDIFYSGTVAAAMEGCFLGLPALAVSLPTQNPQHYVMAAEIAKLLTVHVQNNSLPAKTMLNVNIPDVPSSKLRGFAVTRLGTRHIAAKTIPSKDPRGKTIYWIGPPGPEQDAGPGTDFYAINNFQVSLTPLHLDLTNYRAFDKLNNWVNSLSTSPL